MLRLALATALIPAAMPAGAQSPPLPGPGELLHFAGTEPFWDGTVLRNRMVFKTPDNQRGEAIRLRRHDMHGQIRLQGRTARDGAFTMTVLAKACSDGMSDNTYPYDVTIAFRSRRINGCGWTGRHRYKQG